jgi:hypothetical protein
MVVSLFEELEQEVAPYLLEMTHENYKEPLTKAQKDELDRCVALPGGLGQEDTATLPLQSLCIALQRFTIRFLDTDYLDPAEPISFQLCGQTRWPLPPAGDESGENKLAIEFAERMANGLPKTGWEIWADKKWAQEPPFLPSLALAHAFFAHEHLQKEMDRRQAAVQEAILKEEFLGGGGGASSGASSKQIRQRPQPRKRTGHKKKKGTRTD